LYIEEKYLSLYLSYGKGNSTMNFGQALTEIRLRKKLSKVEFAEQLNISRVTLNKIESGEHLPPQKVIDTLKKKFEISPYTLVLLSLTDDEIEDIKLEIFKDTRSRLLNKIY